MPELVHRLQVPGAVLLETITPDDEQPVVWLFDEPVERVVARSAADVDPAMRYLDRMVERGFYAAGYIAYEAGYALEPASGAASAADRHPLLWFGIYRAPVVIEESGLATLQTAPDFRISQTRFAYTRAEYADAFRRIQHHIREGDVYQINFTGPLRFQLSGSPIRLFDAVRRRQRRGLGAYIQTEDRTILSRSPELFFTRDGGRIRTRPMKGTAPRGGTVEEDEDRSRALSTDLKSRAENLMIVDLLRNDLSVVCEPGSVRVPALFATELHETLIQMTSTVEGRLRDNVTYRDLFRALFPCGSVTGAPRIRAMRIIQALESDVRGVYCGAIGWMGPDQRAAFNVAIRTAEIVGSEGRLGIGSGIVWDSRADAEYEECLLKAKFFLQTHSPPVQPDETPPQLIETMRWDGEIGLLPLHLQRLRNSAAVFGFALDEQAVLDAVQSTTERLSGAARKVRLLVGREGVASVSVQEVDAFSAAVPLQLAVAQAPIRSDDPLRRHKTTRRSAYEDTHQAGLRAGVDEVILLNERGEVAEATRHNILIRKEGALRTPPVASGALPGVYRAFLLQTRTDVFEQVLTLADLLTADQIFLSNAVQGLRAATLARDESGRLIQVDPTVPAPTPDAPRAAAAGS